MGGPDLKKNFRVVDLELLDAVRTLPCIACLTRPVEAHHVTTRGAGGGDTAVNVMPLCPAHHREWHQGITPFLRKFPSVRYWLEFAGRTDVLERIARKFKTPAQGHGT